MYWNMRTLLQALNGGQRWLEWHQDFLSQQNSRKQVELVMNTT